MKIQTVTNTNHRCCPRQFPLPKNWGAYTVKIPRSMCCSQMLSVIMSSLESSEIMETWCFHNFTRFQRWHYNGQRTLLSVLCWLISITNTSRSGVIIKTH